MDLEHEVGVSQYSLILVLHHILTREVLLNHNYLNQTLHTHYPFGCAEPLQPQLDITRTSSSICLCSVVPLLLILHQGFSKLMRRMHQSNYHHTLLPKQHPLHWSFYQRRLHLSSYSCSKTKRSLTSLSMHDRLLSICTYRLNFQLLLFCPYFAAHLIHSYSLYGLCSQTVYLTCTWSYRAY